MSAVIGREEEKMLLSKIERSREPELVAVYGRRRVGKTYLIRSAFQKEMAFEFSGIHNASQELQLENFGNSLSVTAGNGIPVTPVSWMEAFRMLTDYLAPLLRKHRRVVFIDEFPWLNTPRSGFLQAFEHFWNTWASRQDNLIVVICGSSAAWMIQKVLNNRGGLHNRVTRRIRLMPFTLAETEAFLRSRRINLDQYQLLQLYMVMGGIPQYLKEVEPGESAMQAIDRTCFTKDGLLRDEFNNLFLSLFDNAAEHTSIIKALAARPAGLNRSGILAACRLRSGGGVTRILDELTESGFITPYIPFDRTVKDSIYKLTDEYSRFYLKFIGTGKLSGPGAWAGLSSVSSWKSWSATAFESICMKHTKQIKKALGIEGLHTEASMWRYRSKEETPGAQIDLLLDRNDRCVNICEMKFVAGEFEITKKYAKELENKIAVFRDSTRTRKTLFLTMVTTHGVKNTESFPGLVQSQVTMTALFA